MSASSAAGGSPADAWSRLWRTGVLHSCATGIAGNYDGPIAAFWDARFARLADGDRVVDIGTGNGALPLLAKAHGGRRGLRFDLHGVDLADIDPPASLPGGPALFEGIRFHPRTGADRLPFESGSVRLLTSQYAFEYMPRDAALAEILRVVADDGSAAFVLHSRDSLICGVAAEQLAAGGFLFDASDVFTQARAVVDLLAHTADPLVRAKLAADPQAEAVRLRFNTAAQGLMDAIARWPRAELLRKAVQAIGGVVQRAPSDPTAAHADLAGVEAALRHEVDRLRHLDAAILDPDAIERLAACFRDAGFGAVAIAPLDQRPGARMGWTLVADRG